MAVIVTTTGTITKVILNDLGARTLVHPTVSLDLELEYSLLELVNSDDLQSAIDNNYVTIVDGSGNPITSLISLIMKESTFDSNQDDIVDIAATASNTILLDNLPGSYYLDAENLTGTINIDNIDETEFSFYPLIIRGNELISGAVSWVDNLDFYVSDLVYTIGGEIFEVSGTFSTLNTAHPTLDRIDVFVADIYNNISVLEGDPSASPIKPDVDEFSQIEVSYVNVLAGATSPDIEQTMIFDENVGYPTEWNATYSSPDVIIDFSDSYSGTYSAHFQGGTDSHAYFGLTQAITINADVFQFFLKSKGNWDNGPLGKNYLRAALFNNDGRLSKWVRIEDGYQGFDSSDISNWQPIALRRASISLQGSLVDEVRFEIAGTGSGIGFFLDRVNYQAGIGSEKNELVTIGDLESGLIGAFGAYSMFGNTTETPNNGLSTPSKVAGTTTLEELTTGFEDDGVSNRLKFTEPDTRTFEVECTLSAQAEFSNNTYQFYFYKNGSDKIEPSRITVDFVSGGNSQTVVIGDYVEMSQNDYIELWCQNDTSGAGTKTITIESMNFRIKKIN